MSTFSSYKIELIGTGEQTGQWGNTTNDNLQYAIQQSIGGYSLITLVSNSYALPYADTTGLQDFRSLYLEFVGTLTAAGTVTVPAIQKTYIVANNTVGGFTLTVKVAGQTGITIPNGAVAILYCNGTDVVNGQNYISSLTLGTPLPAASGGLPTQTNQTNKFLTTDGTTASWGVTGIKTVKAASTGTLTLSGTQTVDGVALIADDRILVKNQTATEDNGIYVVAASTWARADDFNTSANVAGSTVNIQAGTVNGGLIFTTGFKSTDTLGVSSMTWTTTIALPSQTNNANKVLGTNATTASWVVPAAITVQIATTAAITTTGVQVIDGITTTTGDRVLVKNQGAASGNGVYVAAAGAWARSNDMSTALDVAATIVVVQYGTVNGGKQFATTFKATDTINTTAMNWFQVTSGTVPATTGGTGITSYVIGDLLYADTTTSLAKLADAALTNVLISGGVGAAPSWGKVVASSMLSATGSPSATTYLRGDNTWATVTGGGTGTVTSVSAGNGMNFTTITGSGSVTMGVPSSITSASTNTVGTGTHSHAITGAAFLAGIQTFTGAKTFTGGIESTSFNFTSTSSIYLTGSTIAFDVSSTRLMQVVAASFAPGGDNNKTLGTAALRWSTVYAAVGTINTSDANTKQDIAELDEAERRVAVAIKGLIKKFRFKDAVAEKGAAARIHVGVIAQEVQTAFAAEGLDASRYGLFCSDTWWEKEVQVERNGITSTEVLTSETSIDGYTERTRLGMRYEELLAFVIAAL